MKIGIVGLGYVGLPLAVAFCEAGHDVVGVDTDPPRGGIGRGESYVEDMPSERLQAAWSGCIPPRATPTGRRPTPWSSRCPRR